MLRVHTATLGNLEDTVQRPFDHGMFQIKPESPALNKPPKRGNPMKLISRMGRIASFSKIQGGRASGRVETIERTVPDALTTKLATFGHSDQHVIAKRPVHIGRMFPTCDPF